MEIMRSNILNKLEELEKREQIKILYAVESGSRAWGFASGDSDYDVRFLYIRPIKQYLRLEKKRDVIELPVDAVYDINGWDFQKALILLHKSNPTLFEWCNSPVVYRTSAYFEQVKPLLEAYFQPKAGLYHYLHMSNRDFKETGNKELIKIKKYFYIVRPLLACKWILQHHSPPPVLFQTLLESQGELWLQKCMQQLREQKRATTEGTEIERIPQLDAYIAASLANISDAITQFKKDQPKDWNQLNSLFLSAIAE